MNLLTSGRCWGLEMGTRIDFLRDADYELSVPYLNERRACRNTKRGSLLPNPHANMVGWDTMASLSSGRCWALGMGTRYNFLRGADYELGLPRITRGPYLKY